jgi:hypothetical protein
LARARCVDQEKMKQQHPVTNWQGASFFAEKMAEGLRAHRNVKLLKKGLWRGRKLATVSYDETPGKQGRIELQ